MELGHEVLGVDIDTKTVQDYAEKLTHVVQVDSTDPDAMTQIGATEFRTAVVAIGTDVRSEHSDHLAARRSQHRADRGEGDYGGARKDPRARGCVSRDLP